MNLLSDGTARNVLRLIFTFSCYDLLVYLDLFQNSRHTGKKNG